jgi:nucleoside-diphosphate-sugar epimerase
MSASLPDVFIVGCGDIGRRVARIWGKRGVAVSAIARRESARVRLNGIGVATCYGDLDVPESLLGLPVGGTLLYYFAPPPPEGVTDPRMRAFIAALDCGAPPARIVYISTTGVYGNCNGAWVREDTPPNPQSDRGKRRLDAENAVRDYGRRYGVPVVCLRVSGIYSHDRLPIKALRERRPVLDEAVSGFTNHIHADDLARVCVAAAERGGPDSIYNVSDGHPGTLAGFYNRVADALRLPRPPVIPHERAREVLGAAMQTYLDESRRISNERMLRELQVRLRYPDLAAGLAAVQGQPAVSDFA